MHRLLIGVALLLLAPLAAAQAYKWTDSSGTVHYSDAAPAQGTKFERVTTTGSVEPLAAPSAREDAEAPETAAEPTPPVPDTPENRTRLCDSLKTNLAALQGSGPVVMQQDGKTVALDDAQRKQQAASSQAQFEQFCQ